MAPAVELQGITKRFGNLTAVDDVSIAFERGKLHAVVGENGAGKTTLMRVLYGLYVPDAGGITLDGASMRFRTPNDAIRHGVGMVSQHYAIIPQLTCLDNLLLGAEGGFVIPRAHSRKRAEQVAQQMGFAFDWNSEASELSTAGCQKLEILKLLWRDASVMILDEPTAMLSPEDAEALYASLKRLASAGRTVIVVSHRLSEVLNHCDRVAVLRNGRKVLETETGSMDRAQLAEAIIGERLSPPGIHAPVIRGELLKASSLTARGDRGEVAVREATFDVRQGEVFGIAGVDGSGQRELVQAILGLRPCSGRLELGGRDLSRSKTADRFLHGMRHIPEDRLAEGVILDWTLQNNALLGVQRSELATTHGIFDKEKVRAVALDSLRRFDTRAHGLEALMQTLSGGNQQRFVAGRALVGKPTLLVAFQPTRGLDIRGERAVFSAIRQACDEGMSAIVVSFDLDELLQNCDRIAVMYAGSISFPPDGAERDRNAIGRMMVGLPA
jgi:simple sugar transport system ATP-binding protein